jgi:hypothetical protein
MRLDDIKARVAAATPGPWEVIDLIGSRPAAASVWTDEDGDHDVCLSEETSPADAAFIAHARTDIPDLLRVVEAAMAVVEMTRAAAVQLLATVEAEGVVVDDETRTALLEGNEPGHPLTILAAALADLDK